MNSERHNQNGTARTGHHVPYPMEDPDLDSDAILERFVDFTAGVMRLLQRLPKCAEAEVAYEHLFFCCAKSGVYFSSTRTAATQTDYLSTIHLTMKALTETIYLLWAIREAGWVPDLIAAFHCDEAEALATHLEDIYRHQVFSANSPNERTP